MDSAPADPALAARIGGARELASLAGGVLAGATGALVAAQAGLPVAAAWTAAVTFLCIVWWLTEAIPLAATALVPIAVLPLVGVLSADQVASAYGDPLILLFLGGFLLSAAVEDCGLHRRLALGLVRRIGSSGRRLVLGFTLASSVLSMWMSNTATVMVLLPVALAVLDKVRHERLAACVLLGIAYGATIGGMATPIGSPPNAVFLGMYEQYTGRDLGFLGWMSFSLPVIAVLLPLTLAWLSRGLGGVPGVSLPAVGAWRSPEKRVLAVFVLAVCAWITRTAPYGGWSHWLALPGASDASVALVAAIALSLLPSGEGGRLLEWRHARNIPWDVLVLFAGGIAIAQAFEVSGLSRALGALPQGASDLPVVLLVLCTVALVTLLSEVSSNTATAVLVLPILAMLALGSGLDPLLLMMPAALAASCGFALPVATPPNAIVYGTGRLPLRVMLRRGLALDAAAALVITAVCSLVVAG